MKEKQYRLNENRQFIIENYQNKRPFSSFLPGIAGRLGIPIWAFYVNRGQGLASFGSENKDNSIMEFYPANKSYSNVETKGFRTFIKINEKIYEPFRKLNNHITSRMIISPDALEIVETNKDLELKTHVKYFILPNESFGALVRKVSIENLSTKEKSIEVLDGMPIVIPYGIENEALKSVSQTISAWIKVYNFENKAPFYRLSASAEDEAKVEQMKAGNFYFAISDQKLLSPIVDPEVIFKESTSLENPSGFYKTSLHNYSKKQILENRFPCAMASKKSSLTSHTTLEITSVYGHLANQEAIDTVVEKFMTDSYVKKKETASQMIHQYYGDHIFTSSEDTIFAAYTNQTFLDNVLRGGFPIALGNEKIYHIFSRKHGDLERDYNYFSLEPAYYSQGNGNYRDVNQNRRSDVFFNPKVKDHNIKVFYNLLQMDGYNPLVINGQKYSISSDKLPVIITLVENHESIDPLLKKLETPFSPGEIAMTIVNNNISLIPSLETFINTLLEYADSRTDASFGEGYWIDHWTYNLDLIENYLAIYPDKLEELLVQDQTYTFFDSYYKVLPRNKKYVLTDNGPRQYEALEINKEKKELIESRSLNPFHVRQANGHGDIFYTCLLAKIVTLITVKISTLDPYGIGIEMEANKPGWYDALNGLPGIFGSSLGETAELLRLINFTQAALQKISQKNIELPFEVYDFLSQVNGLISDWMIKKDNFSYWDKSASAREEYRETVFWGIDGVTEKLSMETLDLFLSSCRDKLKYSIAQGKRKDGIYSMFFSYKPHAYKKLAEKSPTGEAYVKITDFHKHELPPFLEGQVRTMKILEEKHQNLHSQVKASELYDTALKMYRVNGDITEESYEIGRARAFSPGWLENGSIWLHMQYKYLLELLKANLYEEYYEEIKNALIAYQNPEVYGRSILENSSFILSSFNNDSKNHGRGYIARLSGATAEFIHMWTIMCFGKQPIKFKDDELIYEPKPVLTANYFTTDEKTVMLQISEEDAEKIFLPSNTFAYRFLGQTLVVYHNPHRKDTYGENRGKIQRYELTSKNNKKKVVQASVISGEMVHGIREGEFKQIDIFLA